jgi:hypothetical protein
MKERFRSNLFRIIVKNILKLKPYTNQKMYGLTKAQKESENANSTLVNMLVGNDIIYSDEKLFLLQETHNQQPGFIFHGVRRHFEKRQFTPSFRKNEYQYQPYTQGTRVGIFR